MNWIRQWWWWWKGVTPYGWELQLDLHDCEPKTFTREMLEAFFAAVCSGIDMTRCDLHWWDYRDEPDHQVEPHLEGTSAVQFILTSNITIHTLDLLGKVYINVFSCKTFKPEIVKRMASAWFHGRIVQANFKPRW